MRWALQSPQLVAGLLGRESGADGPADGRLGSAAQKTKEGRAAQSKPPEFFRSPPSEAQLRVDQGTHVR